jgi:hypothetical protein
VLWQRRAVHFGKWEGSGQACVKFGRQAFAQTPAREMGEF